MQHLLFQRNLHAKRLFRAGPVAEFRILQQVQRISRRIFSFTGCAFLCGKLCWFVPGQAICVILLRHMGFLLR